MEHIAHGVAKSWTEYMTQYTTEYFSLHLTKYSVFGVPGSFIPCSVGEDCPRCDSQ